MAIVKESGVEDGQRTGRRFSGLSALRLCAKKLTSAGCNAPSRRGSAPAFRVISASGADPARWLLSGSAGFDHRREGGVGVVRPAGSVSVPSSSQGMTTAASRAACA